MPFVQVLCLLALLAYLLLVGLENPGMVRLPLPLGRGEMLLSTGWAVSLFALLGGGYMLLLLLPPVVRGSLRQRKEGRERRLLERRLTETLGARVALPGSPGPETTVARGEE
ncbi:hypothetical protein [Deinococcus wulumuqiensis]|nr:hypothetical protein [Deinococcus wulumuqiensis]